MRTLIISHRAYLDKLVAIYSRKSLPDRLDTVYKGLEHEDMVYGLFRMLKVDLGREDDELMK